MGIISLNTDFQKVRLRHVYFFWSQFFVLLTVKKMTNTKEYMALSLLVAILPQAGWW